MIPNFIQKYLSKRINFTYDEVNPGSFDQFDLQTQILEETIDNQVTDRSISALKLTANVKGICQRFTQFSCA